MISDALLYAPYLRYLVRFSGARRISKDPLGTYYYLLHVKISPRPREAHLGTAQALMPNLEIERERKGCSELGDLSLIQSDAARRSYPRHEVRSRNRQIQIMLIETVAYTYLFLHLISVRLLSLL